MKPEKSAIDIEIEKLEQAFFINEKAKEKRRSNAFQFLCLSVFSDIDYDDIKDSDIIDGDDEVGIDIVNIDEEENIVTIFNCKSGKGRKAGYLESDLIKLKRGLEYIFKEKSTIYGNLKNFRLRKRIEDIRSIKESINEINIHYCVFNGEKINEKIERERILIVQEFQKIISFEYPNAKLNLSIENSGSIYKNKLSRTESLKHKIIELEYYDKDKKLKPENTTGNNEVGYVLTVEGEVIAKLVHENGEKLFEKNVRGWFKYKRSNAEIYDTCKNDKASLFWFLNNGITMVGDLAFPDSDRSVIKVKNLQIVNGQQTARILHSAFLNGELKKGVRVLCKIYTGGGDNFVNDIAKATNNQISIGNRDLVSNDPRQLAIAEFFNKFNIFYKRQREQKKPSQFKTMVTSKDLARIIIALILRRPSFAMKPKESEIFDVNKDYYLRIFERNPKELLIAYLVYKFCKEKEDKMDELSSNASLHIAMIIWNKNIDKIKNYIDNLENSLPVINLNIEYKYGYDLMGDLIRKNKKEEFKSIGHYISRLEFEDLLNALL
jgi:hypothetical protein